MYTGNNTGWYRDIFLLIDDIRIDIFYLLYNARIMPQPQRMNTDLYHCLIPVIDATGIFYSFTCRNLRDIK